MSEPSADPTQLGQALHAIGAFTGSDGSLTRRIAGLEASLQGLRRDEIGLAALDAGISADLLPAAQQVKALAGQINVVIHAIGIITSLPYILEEGEQVESLSLGAGNTGRDWDLATDRQIAEFKFITWRGGPESIRQNTLFADVFHLAEAVTERRRVLYVTGIEHPLRFLENRRAIRSVLSKNAKLAEQFESRYGSRFARVNEYWAAIRDRVEIVDLTTVVPDLMELDGRAS